jgi:hypothetical protein
MTKTIIYLVLLALLGFGVYYFLFSERDAFGAGEAGFKITDTGSISKIFLADKTGSTVTLERKGDMWMLDNKYPAMQAPVTTLLQTLATQTPSYPVPATMHNNVIKTLAATGIKIELYNKDGKKIRVFYVGGQANNLEGTYMLMEGSKKPYVVQIPGFEGYITPRYSTQTSDWRDRTVCDIPREELKSVTVKYIETPLNSYTVLQTNTGDVTVDADSALIKGQQLNKRRAIAYTGFFTKLYHEGYINGTTGLDSIIRTAPKMVAIDVAGTKGQSQHIEVFWMAITRRSKNMLTPAPGLPANYDADRFYATINNFKDTVIIQRGTFDKVLRKAYEFYQPDDTTVHKQLYEKGTGSIQVHPH